MRSARVGSASAVPFVLAVACFCASAQDGKKPEPQEKPAKADAGKKRRPGRRRPPPTIR
jgi:hypothetical protein